jgi:toxin YoeB
MLPQFEQYSSGYKDASGQKINDLIKSIERDGPMKGLGKPEKMKYRKGEYSRRIDGENRLVYGVSGDTINIISCKGHYEE